MAIRARGRKNASALQNSPDDLSLNLPRAAPWAILAFPRGRLMVKQWAKAWVLALSFVQ